MSHHGGGHWGGGHHGGGHHGGGHHGGGHHGGGHHGGGHHLGGLGGGHHGGSYHGGSHHGSSHSYVGYHQTGPAPGGCQPPHTQMRPTQPYGQQPPSYNAQQRPPGGRQMPPGVDPMLWSWFVAVDRDNSGAITANELQHALMNNNWSHFNPETCRLMIGMFDKNKSGTIDIHEFAALWKYVQDWKGCFDRFDTDRSGTIDQNELSQAFTTFGYRLSADFCNLCVRVFDRGSAHTMKFDDFIQCCVMLKTLTDAFRKYDTNMNGVINISYEQFMEMALDNTL